MTRAPGLRSGDRIRLIAPADGLAEALTARGFAVELGEDSPDGFRDAFGDPGAWAVVASARDDGHRIARHLDFDAVRRSPKLLVGSGGIAYLHLVLWRECGLAGIHAPAEPGDALYRALVSVEPVTLHSHPADFSAAVSVPGSATGVLLGGSLTQLRALVGVGLPSLDGAVLLLDDRRTIGLGQVDRQLTHLRRAGALDGVRGVVLGRFPGFEDFTDRGWTLREVLRDRLGDLGVPVLGGIRVGEEPVPVGGTATLDADAGTLVVEAAIR